MYIPSCSTKSFEALATQTFCFILSSWTWLPPPGTWRLPRSKSLVSFLLPKQFCADFYIGTSLSALLYNKSHLWLGQGWLPEQLIHHFFFLHYVSREERICTFICGVPSSTLRHELSLPRMCDMFHWIPAHSKKKKQYMHTPHLSFRALPTHDSLWYKLNLFWLPLAFCLAFPSHAFRVLLIPFSFLALYTNLIHLWQEYLSSNWFCLCLPNNSEPVFTPNFSSKPKSFWWFQSVQMKTFILWYNTH